jgi:hypothetical protein
MSEQVKKKDVEDWVAEPLEIPPHWVNADFEAVIDVLSINDLKIPQKEYLAEGDFPVVDQGAELIGGYTADATKVISIASPVIVFGDHTRCLKYINFDFAPGADGVKVLRPYTPLDSKYLWYATRILKLPNRGYSRHFSFLKKSLIPIAPLNEQKRIVAKIEELFSELDSGIESLKTARAQLKVYRQAVLKHAFEGKLTAAWREQNKVSSKWKLSELGKCGKWQGGGTPSKSVPAYWENGDILWISPKDMKTRIVKNSQQKITRIGVENSPAKITSGEAVLFVVRSGILRRVLPVAIAVPGVTVNQDMQAVVPSNHSVEFLYWYCEANEQAIRHECSKDGTTVESIDVASLKRFPVPVPTLDEQNEIVRLIEAQVSVIENIETTIDAELQKSEALRQSILKKAFSGQLVAQDTKDEPASALLSRIRAEKTTATKKPKTKRRAA